jgi:ATP-dependent helicase HrpB
MMAPKPEGTDSVLPILAYRESIMTGLDKVRSLILCAPPGTGKSTQVPRFLLERPGKILVLQPRRIAARNLALRVAEELGEAVGGRVGYQVRFEGKSQDSTRILYQTYGVFFQQLLNDPTLAGIGAVLLDEFHERTLEADATLAWLKKIRVEARPDLNLIVMSATLDLEGLGKYLFPAPVIEVEAVTYPVEIFHQPAMSQESLPLQAQRALKKLLGQGLTGSVLIFMPGQGEIRRTVEMLDPLCRLHGLALHELHGSMDMEAQQRTLRAPQLGLCVIVSTNVAETSLTIPGVTIVIDSGLARTAAFSPQRDMNTLYLASISLQSAKQRSGRAGRTAPGQCIRLWGADRERAMPIALDPEVLRVEPTSMALSLYALLARYRETYDGKQSQAQREPQLVSWLTPPASGLWEKAEKALLRIGAVDADTGFITETGKALARFPAHPVLARVLVDARKAGVGELAAAMVAILESQGRKAKGPTLDLFAEGEDLAHDSDARHWDRETRESYRQLLRIVNGSTRNESSRNRSMGNEAATIRETVTGCWLVPFQERLAVRQEKSQSFLLADGRKAVLEPGQIANDINLILALELYETGGANQNRQVGIPVALPCQAAWVTAAFPGEGHWTKVGGWDMVKGKVVQEEHFLFRGLSLEKRPLREGDLDPAESERLLVEKLMAGEIELPKFDDEAKQWVQRIRLAAKHFPEYGLPKLDDEDWRLLYHEICHGKASIRELESVSVTHALQEYLGPNLTAFLDKVAPVNIKLPGVRMGKFTYFENSPPELAARLGDFVGLEGRMTVLEGKVDVIYDILAPNYRTVQKTADLTSFWKNTYPEVKKELKRRYPKHPWP